MKNSKATQRHNTVSFIKFIYSCVILKVSYRLLSSFQTSNLASNLAVASLLFTIFPERSIATRNMYLLAFTVIKPLYEEELLNLLVFFAKKKVLSVCFRTCSAQVARSSIWTPYTQHVIRAILAILIQLKYGKRVMLQLLYLGQGFLQCAVLLSLDLSRCLSSWTSGSFDMVENLGGHSSWRSIAKIDSKFGLSAGYWYSTSTLLST